MTCYQHKRVFDRCFYSWLGDANIDVCLKYENMENFISFSQRLSVLGRTKVQEMKRKCGGESILGWFISNITKIEIESDICKIESI